MQGEVGSRARWLSKGAGIHAWVGVLAVQGEGSTAVGQGGGWVGG